MRILYEHLKIESNRTNKNSTATTMKRGYGSEGKKIWKKDFNKLLLCASESKNILMRSTVTDNTTAMIDT